MRSGLNILWRLRWCAALVCLATLAGGLPPAYATRDELAKGDETAEQPEEPPRKLMQETRSRAWRVTHKAGRGGIDVFFVVEKLLDLNEGQEKALKTMEEDYEARENKQDGCLQKGCLRQVRKLLEPDQRKVLDAAIEELERLEKAQKEATEQFLKAADPEARKQTDTSGGRVNTSDLTRYLDVPGAMRKQLDRLYEEMYERVDKHMAEKKPPKDLEGGKLRRWKLRERRKAQREARQWYEGQRDALLNQDQLKRLKGVEEAGNEYRNRLRDAHRQCAANLQNILLAAAGYPQPDEEKDE
jgi:hypothetical protein